MMYRKSTTTPIRTFTSSGRIRQVSVKPTRVLKTTPIVSETLIQKRTKTPNRVNKISPGGKVRSNSASTIGKSTKSIVTNPVVINNPKTIDKPKTNPVFISTPETTKSFKTTTTEVDTKNTIDVSNEQFMSPALNFDDENLVTERPQVVEEPKSQESEMVKTIKTVAITGAVSMAVSLIFKKLFN